VNFGAEDEMSANNFREALIAINSLSSAACNPGDQRDLLVAVHPGRASETFGPWRQETTRGLNREICDLGAAFSQSGPKATKPSIIVNGKS
jgi:hypothetical protein